MADAKPAQLDGRAHQPLPSLAAEPTKGSTGPSAASGKESLR